MISIESPKMTESNKPAEEHSKDGNVEIVGAHPRIYRKFFTLRGPNIPPEIVEHESSSAGRLLSKRPLKEGSSHPIHTWLECDVLVNQGSLYSAAKVHMSGGNGR